MLLTLNTNAVRSLVKPKGRARPVVTAEDLPQYAKDQFGVHGVNFTTDILKGSDRRRIETIRERADKASCACLVLIELETQMIADRRKAAGAIDRTKRVLEAAHVLGCSSAAVPFEAPDTDEAFEIAAANLRQCVDHAEKRDMHLLMQPRPGLTGEPERLTDLIKKVGGFRLGTMPDFQTAAATDDPESYLRRITPYASLVNATTLHFEEPAPTAAPAKKQAKAAEDAGEAKPSDADAEAEADEDVGGDEDDLMAALIGGGGGGGLEALLEAIDDEPPPLHTPYPLAPLLAAVQAVGYEGTLAVDYQGDDDVSLGILHSVAALEAALEELAGG